MVLPRKAERVELPAAWRDLFRKSGRILDAALGEAGLSLVPAPPAVLSDGVALPDDRGAQYAALSAAYGSRTADDWRDLVDGLDAVWQVVRRAGLLPSRFDEDSRVFLMSFAELALRRWREMAPGAPTVFLMERIPRRCRKGWLPFSARVAGPSVELLREYPGYVARVHAAGGRVFVWTVDEPDDIDLCLRLGVDAMVTNQPGAVRAHLAARK